MSTEPDRLLKKPWFSKHESRCQQVTGKQAKVRDTVLDTGVEQLKPLAPVDVRRA